MAERKTNEASLDAILIEIGQFGKFQILNYCLVVVTILFSAIYSSQYIFNAASTDYRCLVSECDTELPNYNDSASWGPIALPADSEAEARCKRLVPSNATAGNATCDQTAFGQQLIACDRWVYSSHDTVVAELDLACQEWKRTMIGTVHNLGVFAALPLVGYASDRFGRRLALCVTAVSSGVFGLARSFVNSYEAYISLEFFEAMFGSGVYSTGFILAVELVGPDKRVIGGNIISVFFAIGQVVLALFAWWLPYWRTLTRVIYAPSLLFFFYYFVLHESVRWLLSKGRKREAVEIIKKVAVTNGKAVPEKALSLLQTEEQDGGKKQKKLLVLEIIKSKVIMTRLLVCSFWWITVTFVYYGLSINSISLAGNGYVNFILTSLVEIPGYVLSVMTLDRFGRKASIMAAYFICGVSLLSMPFIPASLAWLVTSLSMLGKLCISMTFSSIYIYTSELFPTNSRHSLLGFCSMVGRIGSISAPQTPLLAYYMPSLPYLLFGGMSLAAGLLMTLTPETLRNKLPDTLAEAENITNLRVTTEKM